MNFIPGINKEELFNYGIIRALDIGAVNGNIIPHAWNLPIHTEKAIVIWRMHWLYIIFYLASIIFKLVNALMFYKEKLSQVIFLMDVTNAF